MIKYNKGEDNSNSNLKYLSRCQYFGKLIDYEYVTEAMVLKLLVYTATEYFGGSSTIRIYVPTEMEDSETVITAVTIANRVIGCVNAPALIQKVIGECADLTVDINEYKINRDLLYNGLIECGFECKKPQGAFYLFLKSPIKDEKEFCRIAKEYNILIEFQGIQHYKAIEWFGGIEKLKYQQEHDNRIENIEERLNEIENNK